MAFVVARMVEHVLRHKGVQLWLRDEVGDLRSDDLVIVGWALDTAAFREPQ
jgi:hypothetical protein